MNALTAVKILLHDQERVGGLTFSYAIRRTSWPPGRWVRRVENNDGSGRRVVNDQNVEIPDLTFAALMADDWFVVPDA